MSVSITSDRVAAAASRPALRLRRLVVAHPEWWSVALCVLAWGAMLPHAWRHVGPVMPHALPFVDELNAWMFMVVAMMLPLVIDSVRRTAVGSLWPRRHRAIAGFIVGLLMPWLLLGVAVVELRHTVWGQAPWAPVLAFAVAAAWQLTPVYRRAVNACHSRRPLAPAGWRADRDCVRFGGVIGIAQVASCWPLMLACALAGHGIFAMAGGLAVGALEHWTFRPRVGWVLAVTLALTVYYVALALMS